MYYMTIAFKYKPVLLSQTFTVFKSSSYRSEIVSGSIIESDWKPDLYLFSLKGENESLMNVPLTLKNT